MRTAMDLARTLDCFLVAICSLRISPREVADLGERIGTSTVAVDMQEGIGTLPRFGTTGFLEGSSFERISDAGEKRNLGLLLAWAAGWSRVLFLDDDIHDLDASDARMAAALLDEYPAVGLENAGFPDNSVVCHAYRTLGRVQDQFIGAGALAVSPLRTRSFFPRIYNQDWLFLIGHAVPLRLAVTGNVKQAEFDPFADPNRARHEEFGDCIAEGLFWLLDKHQPLERADRGHWREFLARRRRFICRLLRLADLSARPSMRDRLRASLEAALEVNALITPEICEEYVALWRSDIVAWRRYLNGLPSGVGVERAVAELGLGS